MNAKKSGLVVNILSVSLLGLTLGACEGMDDGAPGPPAPGAAEESFDVISVSRDPGGQPKETRVRMTKSQWQQIVDRRLAAASGSKPRPLADSSVFETRQAQTVLDSCTDPAATWIFSDYNQMGNMTCLYDFFGDSASPGQDYKVSYSIKSYWTGNSYRNGKFGKTLICTSDYDCNLYQSGNGYSVWLNASTCGTFCKGNVYQPPPQTLMSPYVVHVQEAPPF